MKRNPWLENVFRPLMVAGMVGCLAFALVDALRLFNPGWNGAYLVVVCVLATLEACYSYRLIQTQDLRGKELRRFRIVEFVMFFIIIKAASYVGDAWTDVLLNVRSWPSNPLNLFDVETLAIFALAFGLWWLATQTIRDLERIQDPPEYHRDETPPREVLAQRFFWGGGAILLVTGFTRVGIANLLNLQRPSVSGLVLNVLIYFFLGLVMLGQVQFTYLRTYWNRRKIKVGAQLTKRWVRYSLIFVGLAALVAFVLPTGYSIGLLEIVATLLRSLQLALSVIAQLFMFILSIPILLLLMLLPPSRRPQYTPPVIEIQERASENASAAGGLGWFEILRSLVFWAVTVGVVVYVIRTYLRDHPDILQSLRSVGIIRVLFDFMSAVWDRLTGLAWAVGERLPRRFFRRRARSKVAPSLFRFFRLGALSPRERTLYYYLSILRRAGQQGYPRRRSQTPHEYDATLEPHLPYSKQDMAALTQDFVKARYSQHPIDREQEKEVRTRWQKVKEALRTLRRRR